MKVCIIIAVYNGAKTIRETIESILAQTYQDLELIVVDDGSTDDSPKIVTSFKDSRIKYSRINNTGSPVAPRNKAISVAEGELVGFCDQDDIYYPEKLERQIRAYESFKNIKEVGIIVSSADLIDGSGKVIGRNVKPDGYLEPGAANKLLLSGNIITTCTALVPRSVIDEIGALDEDLVGVDDYDWWLRITQKYGILMLGEPLSGWRQSAGSLGADKARQYLENEKIFKKLGDKNEDIRIGHGKNLARIFMALVLQNNLKGAADFYESLTDYPKSNKIGVLLWCWKVSPKLCLYFLRTLRMVGKVAL